MDQGALVLAYHPWSKVGIDLCKCKGNIWVVIVEYMTDRFYQGKKTPGTTVINGIKQDFAIDMAFWRWCGGRGGGGAGRGVMT